MAKLWQFNGGLRLPANKDLSSATPLVKAALPDYLIYPLQQRPGVIAKALVTPGQKVLTGQPIASTDNPLGAPIHAASSGVVTAIEPRLIAHPSGLSDTCIVIATDGLEQALPFTGVADYLSLAPKIIIDKIRQAGIAGLGGGAFPTATKLDTATKQSVDTLIINGAECEPYITCDQRLMQDKPLQIITGTMILLRALQIESAVIAVEDDMPEALASLQQVLGQNNYPQISIQSVPALYPIGGEQQLTQVITGRVTPSGARPVDVGVLCQNIATAAAVYTAIIDGAPLTERVVTITGHGIANPQNLLASIGTPIKDLIKQCGGYNQQVQGLIMGGPMMGFALPDDTIAISNATNCILAADANEFPAKKPAMPCIRCGDCAQVCPATLLPQQLYWYSRADELDKTQDYGLFDCIECGCCEIVCPSHIPLVQYYRASKSKIKVKNQEAESAALAKRRYQQKTARIEHEKKRRAETISRKKAALLKTKSALATQPKK